MIMTQDLAEDLPPVQMNAIQIEQVITNLLRKARQVTPGSVHVQTATRRLKKQAQLSVADDGPDFPAEQLSQIFDPCFTTNQRRGGTGLGLSICHTIITDHNGTIRAAKADPGGAVFTITLPIAP